MHKENLALYNQRLLIYHKNQSNETNYPNKMNKTFGAQSYNCHFPVDFSTWTH